MKRYIARGIGVVVGFPAGPIGIVFGFLLGTLVDQYRSDVSGETAFQRYLSNPGSVRRSHRIAVYITAILIGDLIHRTYTGHVQEMRESAARIAAKPWPGDRSSLISSVARETRRRLVIHVLDHRESLDPTSYARDFDQRRSRDGSPSPLRIVSFLVESISEETGTIETDASAYLYDLLRLWEIDPVHVPLLHETPVLLDGDACRVLGVSRTADRSEIKHAYRLLATNMHPDTSLVLEAYQQNELSDAFIRIRSAYDTLCVDLDRIESDFPARYGAADGSDFTQKR